MDTRRRPADENGGGGARAPLTLPRLGGLLLVTTMILAICHAHRHHGTWRSWGLSEACCGHLRHHREHVRDFSCGRLYYRTFYVDVKRDALYVGAMDKVFRLNMNNINRSRCELDSLTLKPSNVANCVSKGKSEHYDCRNHIRVIQPVGDGSKIYVCGTNAHSPMNWVIHANLTHLGIHEDFPGIGNGVAQCPFDPDDNSTAIWVEKGNPSNLPGLYSATVADFTKADTVIFRTDLYNMTTGEMIHPFKRTIKFDSKWLDKPDFVGSYDIGEYVYFFFRESAVEYINCGKNIYSRVARVCKVSIYEERWRAPPSRRDFCNKYEGSSGQRDTGGKNILNKNWASFLKARLNCSIPGEFPFYFNEIQSIYKHPEDDKKFFAVFTTSMNGLMGSAICTFNLDSIQEVFNGKFKEQATSSSAWLPVLSSKVPEPRPGLCVNDTQTLPDSVLNFIRGHPLMDSAVSHNNGKPVFYKRDVIFTNLVVDRFEVDGVRYVVYYAGTSDGLIYKLVEWYDRAGEEHSNLIDIFEATSPEAIRAMVISNKHKSMYVGSDSGVRQFDLIMCKGRYENCLRCIQDPYCGWDRDHGECKPYTTGLLQDITNATPGICDSSVKSKPLHVYWGQSIHISCALHLPEVEGLGMGPLRWYHYTRDKGKYEVGHRREKYVHTADHGLVILSVTERDSGRYDCKLGSNTLCSYNLTVDAKTCSAPSESEYKKIYSDWCHEFEKYKLAMKTWQNKQVKCQTAHPNDVTYQGNPSL